MNRKLRNFALIGTIAATLLSGCSWPFKASNKPNNNQQAAQTIDPSVQATIVQAVQATLAAGPQYGAAAPANQPAATQAIQQTPISESATNKCLLPSLVIPEYRFDGRDWNGADLTSFRNAVYERAGLSPNDKIKRVIINDPSYPNELEVIVNDVNNLPIEETLSAEEVAYGASLTAGYRKEITWYTMPCLTNALEAQGKTIEGLAALIAKSQDAQGKYTVDEITADLTYNADRLIIAPNLWCDEITDPAVLTLISKDANGKPRSIYLTKDVGGKIVPDDALLAEIQDYLGLPK